MKNELVPYLIRHCLAGFAAGWSTVALILWTDLAGVGTLATASDLWPIPHAMLFAFFGLTFGAAAMGAAIMALSRESAEPRPSSRHSVLPFTLLQPVQATRRSTPGAPRRPAANGS